MTVAEHAAVWDRIGDRRSWQCCACDAHAIGARGEPEVALRARLTAAGWTYERLSIDSQPTGRVWCPRHDPILPKRLAEPRLADFDGTPVLVTHSNVALSEPGSPYLRGAPIA